MNWIFFFKRIEFSLKKIRMIALDLGKYKIKKCKSNGVTSVSSIKKPVTFNEKLIHKMIYGMDDRIRFLSNKLGVRAYISKRIGSEYLVPILGVYKSAREIEFDLMPDSFVLKCNHDSGSAIIVRDKEELDKQLLLSRIALSQSKNMYYITGESQYRKIPPLVMCEELIKKKMGVIIDVVRVHCFHGIPSYYEIDIIDDNGREFINMYDASLKYLDVKIDNFDNNEEFDLLGNIPKNLDILSAKVSEGFDYCRVDWLCSGKKVYFSEITFTPYAGCMKFTPDEYDHIFGALW